MISRNEMAHILEEISEAIRTNNAESISHLAQDFRDNDNACVLHGGFAEDGRCDVCEKRNLWEGI